VADARPIGIVDSGVGGLAVLAEIVRRLPGESTVYFADTRRGPYGPRPDEQILAFSRESLAFLVEQSVKAVVIASGTMTAVALRDLRLRFDVPIIGAIQEGAAAAIRATRTRRVGVIGSTATIRSHAWFQALRVENPASQVVELATPAIEALLVTGPVNGPEAERVVAEALGPMERIDTLVLGGSGYSLLRALIQGATGERVAIVDSVSGIATALVELLSVNGLEAPGSSRGTAADAGREGHDRPAERGGIATHVQYVSGDVAAFRALADRLFGAAHRDVSSVPGSSPVDRTMADSAVDSPRSSGSGPGRSHSTIRGRAIVVGAGVIGLTTAITALRAGFRVTVSADRLPAETTSAKAGASFKPHGVAHNDLADVAIRNSWDEFGRIVERFGSEATGVRMHTHWEASSVRSPRPWYADVVQDATEWELPDVPGGYRFGWSYRTFFIDVPIFLGWLEGQILAAGGEFERVTRPYADLTELERLPADVVFNCSGMGARALASDDQVVPMKGQIVVVPATPGMDWSISADGFYVYPRRGETVLGGTVERGIDNEVVDPSAIELIVRGNRRILPGLDPGTVIRTYAGARPYRHGSIRIERDPVARTVIHNYGHGGAGFTLCWGSASAAVDLATG